MPCRADVQEQPGLAQNASFPAQTPSGISSLFESGRLFQHHNILLNYTMELTLLAGKRPYSGCTHSTRHSLRNRTEPGPFLATETVKNFYKTGGSEGPAARQHREPLQVTSGGSP